MIKNILLASILAFSGSAFAESIQVVGKQHYQGQNMIRLRAAVNQQLRAQGESPDDYQMVGLQMKAKSKRGQGQATLIVGRDQDTKTIAKSNGGRDLFVVTAPWTYNTVNWDISNSPGDSQERWQLQLNGNIKVRGISVVVESRSQRIRIPMGGELFTQSSTLFLKRELQALGHNVRGKKLKKVVLVSKSKRGRGQAELMVGQSSMGSKNVAGSQGGLGFQNDRPASYNRVKWNLNGRTPGAWQIHMNGRIKVKAVIVELK